MKRKGTQGPGAEATASARPVNGHGNGPARAWWIRPVERPTINEKTAEFGRFSGANIFEIYARLKTERDGDGAVEAEQTSRARRLAAWMREKKPGYCLPDHQLSEGAWTLMRSARPGEGLLSWTCLAVRTPDQMGVLCHTASREEMANTVKAAARFYGAGLAGIAPMNESYVDLRQEQRDIVIEDVDKPSVSAQRFVIPRRMKWVVAMAIPMDLEFLSRAPTALGDAATGLGYSHSLFVVASLAEFIRGLGYEAIPSVNDTAQSVPFAIDAGLGELSRLNKLVTPEFGAGIRLCKVFTDLPMACDKPIDFGLSEHCRTCRVCANACPAHALSFDEEPSFNVRGPWNNPGHKAWFEDSYRCFQYWQKVDNGCGICVASCPYTKAARASSRKQAASGASMSERFFRIKDLALESTAKPDPERWRVGSGR